MNQDAGPSTTYPRTSARGTLVNLLRAMRVKQWVKNIFVFAGIVFAEERLLTQGGALLKVSLAFLFFCLISSSVYLINDLADLEQDRQHPEKRLRPLAAGQLSPRLAGVIAILLPIGCAALIVSFVITTRPMDAGWAWFGLLLLLYFILQLAYTFLLKQIVLVDVFAISAGFILRAVAGAAILLVNITPWWLLSLFFLALFLGLGKRRNELQVLGGTAGKHRCTLQEYSPQFLDYLLLIDIASTIVVYSLATFTAPLVTLMKYPFLMLTIPFVVFALFRYLYLIIQKGKGGEPGDLVFHDSPLLITIVAWGFLVSTTQIVR